MAKYRLKRHSDGQYSLLGTLSQGKLILGHGVRPKFAPELLGEKARSLAGELDVRRKAFGLTEGDTGIGEVIE